MSNEHLLRELRESEEAEDHRNRQTLAPRALGAFKPREVDHAKAMHLYNTEIKPVMDRRKKALTSKAYRLFLKMTGNWKGMEAKDVELVNPTKGLTATGLTDDEIRAEIARNPKGFKEAAGMIPEVHPVHAERRTGIEPRLADEPRDET